MKMASKLSNDKDVFSVYYDDNDGGDHRGNKEI